MPEGKVIDNEVDFIELLHDQQMATEKPGQQIYFRMHKEITPVLIRILQEAAETDDPRRTAALMIMAYANMVAGHVVSIAEIFGGEGEAHAPNRKGLARSLLAAIQEAASEYLAKDEDNPI